MSNHRIVAAITEKRLRELLHYDHLTGLFTRTGNQRGIRAGAVAGGPHNMGYINISVDGKRYLAHRLAWLYSYGCWPEDDVDHINGRRDDNRLENLRDVSHRTNLENRKEANAGRQFLGVSKKRNRWRARVMVAGREIHVGVFDTPDLAYAACVSAKRQLHAGNTL